MDNELSKYIVNYFTDLLTDKEKLGLKHLKSKYKIEHSDNKDNIEQRVQAYKKMGWLTEDKEILDLVRGGEEELDRKIADRILENHRDKVFINNCPSCGRLARTPFARQCRHCGHNWR
jgi:coproporphyrinogen III oxidase-like Fe-S oxidoreductase